MFVYAMEYYSAIKGWNVAIMENMDGSRGYYGNWNNSDRERQIFHYLIYGWNLRNKQKKDRNNRCRESFPCSSVGKESACNAGDPGSIPGLGRPSGEQKSYSLQFSCLENPMDREAWQATVSGIARVGHDLVTKPPPQMQKTDK